MAMRTDRPNIFHDVLCFCLVDEQVVVSKEVIVDTKIGYKNSYIKLFDGEVWEQRAQRDWGYVIRQNQSHPLSGGRTRNGQKVKIPCMTWLSGISAPPFWVNSCIAKFYMRNNWFLSDSPFLLMSQKCPESNAYPTTTTYNSPTCYGKTDEHPPRHLTMDAP